MSKCKVKKVVPGRGAWVITMNDLAYLVMHFIYWRDEEGYPFMSVEVFGAREDGYVPVPAPFEGHVFPSKKAARHYCQVNSLEFNEGEL